MGLYINRGLSCQTQDDQVSALITDANKAKQLSQVKIMYFSSGCNINTLTTVSFFSDAKRTFSGYKRKHFYPFVNKMTNCQQEFQSCNIISEY